MKFSHNMAKTSISRTKYLVEVVIIYINGYKGKLLTYSRLPSFPLLQVSFMLVWRSASDSNSVPSCAAKCRNESMHPFVTRCNCVDSLRLSTTHWSHPRLQNTSSYCLHSWLGGKGDGRCHKATSHMPHFSFLLDHAISSHCIFVHWLFFPPFHLKSAFFPAASRD